MSPFPCKKCGKVEVEGLDKRYYYTRRYKKKKNNKYREILAPSESLKKIQREFADYYYDLKLGILNEPHITGFKKNTSIVDNAKPHIDKEWVVNLDIKDFFPSVSSMEILNELSNLPKKFNLWNWICRKETSETKFHELNPDELLKYLTYEDQLPQGSPASPIIANVIAARKIDPVVDFFTWRMFSLSELNNVDYTRYADDLTISIRKGLINRKDLEAWINNLIECIEDASSFKFNRKKINIKHKSQKQIVTGISVNNGQLGATKDLRNKMRGVVHRYKKENKELDDQVVGVLNFIKSINKKQYNKLMIKEK